MEIIEDSKFGPACGSYYKCTSCNKFIHKNKMKNHKCDIVDPRNIRVSQKKHRQYTDSVIDNIAGIAHKYNT